MSGSHGKGVNRLRIPLRWMHRSQGLFCTRWDRKAPLFPKPKGPRGISSGTFRRRGQLHHIFEPLQQCMCTCTAHPVFVWNQKQTFQSRVAFPYNSYPEGYLSSSHAFENLPHRLTICCHCSSIQERVSLDFSRHATTRLVGRWLQRRM